MNILPPKKRKTVTILKGPWRGATGIVWAEAGERVVVEVVYSDLIFLKDEIEELNQEKGV